MADVCYIVPGGGIVIDQENGYEMIIPGVGIYNEQAAVGGLSIPGFFGATLSPVLPLFKESNL